MDLHITGNPIKIGNNSLVDLLTVSSKHLFHDRGLTDMDGITFVKLVCWNRIGLEQISHVDLVDVRIAWRYTPGIKGIPVVGSKSKISIIIRRIDSRSQVLRLGPVCPRPVKPF